MIEPSGTRHMQSLPRPLAWLVVMSVACAAPLRVPAAELDVAVAANFLGTLQTLAPLYRRASGNELLPSAGSSGQLYAQIRQGAPFDVFLSADSDRPARLEAQGLGVRGSRFTYAIGTLVLWSPKPGVIDSAGKVLSTDGYRTLAIANPTSAPYGAAAQHVLMALDLWDQLNQSKRIVVGENINQAWQFTATGAADLGFVAVSQVMHDRTISGSYWLPPQSEYPPIDQDALLLARSRQRQAAEDFLRWLRHDPHAIAAIEAAGYRVAP